MEVFCIFVFVAVICMANAQTQNRGNCDLSSGGTGNCILLDNCQSALQGLQRGLYPDTCGFQGSKPMVCCPTANSGTEGLSERKCRQYAMFKPEVTVLGIVGGMETLPREFPHMAALGYANGNSIVWRCGGSLVSERYILTAAHCLRSSQYGPVQRVRLGDLNLESTDDEANPDDFGILGVIPHPDYKAPATYNDIALIQLDREVTFSSFIKPACLYSAQEIKPTTDLVATGWGLTKPGGSPSPTLQKVVLSLFTTQECNQTYSDLIATRRLMNGILPAEQFCAGGRTNDQDTCQGDSGGPLQTYRRTERLWSIVGVTSFGKACGVANVPGVYTRVSFYVPWLEKIIWPKN